MGKFINLLKKPTGFLKETFLGWIQMISWLQKLQKIVDFCFGNRGHFSSFYGNVVLWILWWCKYANDNGKWMILSHCSTVLSLLRDSLDMRIPQTSTLYRTEVIGKTENSSIIEIALLKTGFLLQGVNLWDNVQEVWPLNQ